jgi:hypothetical protein
VDTYRRASTLILVDSLLLSPAFNRVFEFQPTLKSFQHKGDISIPAVFKCLEDGVVDLVLRRCCIDDDSSGFGNFAEPFIQFRGGNRAGAGDPFLLELFRRPEINEHEFFAGVEKKLETISGDGRNVSCVMPGLCNGWAESEEPES